MLKKVGVKLSLYTKVYGKLRVASLNLLGSSSGEAGKKDIRLY